MTTACAIALLAMLGFTVWAPALGHRLPPATATRLLVGGGLAIAVATAFIMAVVAATAVAQVPLVARLGEWSSNVLEQTDPFPVWTAALCAALLCVTGFRTVLRLTNRFRVIRELRRDCRLVGSARRVVVVDSERMEAFAAPVGRGRIVVTTGMLRALAPAERRALFAHEQAHLVHRHAWWTGAAELAAWINPLLAPTARAVVRAVERWADEEAARALGDRRLVARAVAKAALHAHHGAGRQVGTMAAVGGDVPARVRALLAPPPVRRVLPVLGLAVLLAVTLGSVRAVQAKADHFFDHAGHPRVVSTVR